MASDGRLLWFGLGGTNGSILAFDAADAGLIRRQVITKFDHIPSKMRSCGMSVTYKARLAFLIISDKSARRMQGQPKRLPCFGW